MLLSEKVALKMGKLTPIVTLMLIASTSLAVAGDARCNAPPYGGQVASYKSFIKNFGPILTDPVKMLSAVCNAKFGGADRKGLYSLGFTDADINSKDTSDLAVEMISAMKNLVGGR